MDSSNIVDFVASKPPVIMTQAYFRGIKPGLIIHYEPTSGDFLVRYSLVNAFYNHPAIGKCDLYIGSLQSVLKLAELWFDQTNSGEYEMGLCRENDWDARFSFTYISGYGYDEEAELGNGEERSCQSRIHKVNGTIPRDTKH